MNPSIALWRALYENSRLRQQLDDLAVRGAEVAKAASRKLAAQREEVSRLRKSLSRAEDTIRNLHEGLEQRDNRIGELVFGRAQLRAEISRLRGHIQRLQQGEEGRPQGRYPPGTLARVGSKVYALQGVWWTPTCGTGNRFTGELPEDAAIIGCYLPGEYDESDERHNQTDQGPASHLASGRSPGPLCGRSPGGQGDLPSFDDNGEGT